MECCGTLSQDSSAVVEGSIILLCLAHGHTVVDRMTSTVFGLRSYTVIDGLI